MPQCCDAAVLPLLRGWRVHAGRSVPKTCPQVNTSSVVLKRLMEGREGEVPLGGSDDVATRWGALCACCVLQRSLQCLHQGQHVLKRTPLLAKRLLVSTSTT